MMNLRLFHDYDHDIQSQQILYKKLVSELKEMLDLTIRNCDFLTFQKKLFYPSFFLEISVEITEEALDKLVRNYCRESGVRSLEKHIEKIARKIAFNTVEKQEGVVMDATSTAASIVSEVIISDEKSIDVSERISESISHEIHSDNIIEVGQEETASTFDFIAPVIVENVKVVEIKPIIDVKKVIVSPENLEVYVGKARFSQDTIYDSAGTSLPPGVVMGLAWNPLVSFHC